MTSPSEQDIAKYFGQGVDCCGPRRDAAKRPGIRMALLLRQQLQTVGLDGRSVVELGCGRGELSLELIRDGAASVVGVDLSPEAIAYARRSATEDGLEDRSEFRVGNGATMELPRADAVVVHQVICCYPDVTGLLRNSIAAAGSIYAYTMPRSRGIWRPIALVALGLENLAHRIKRRGFRAYVHDERVVEEALARAGFRCVARADRGMWFTAAYLKAG